MICCLFFIYAAGFLLTKYYDMKKTSCLYGFVFFILVSHLLYSQSLWQSTSLDNAPAARNGHTMVWTGSNLIVWGGQNYPTIFRSGAKFDTINIWTTIDSLSAPDARRYHTAVWTGSKMIVWGGCDSQNDPPGFFNSGGLYDPVSDSWSPTSMTNVPSARFAHTATWIGNKMIIWGGYNGEFLNTGGIYDPASNTWEEVSLTNAPCEREHHTAIWTGSKLIIWGGNRGYGESFCSGALYDPLTNTWIAMDSVNAPSPRFFHTAVWTGNKMIVWGGAFTSAEIPLRSGGIYDPVSNSWAPLDSINAPAPRSFHSALWTGSKMLIWGGWHTSLEYYKTGGIYDPLANTWDDMDTLNAPSPRYDHKAIWTGNKMILWGGCNPNIENSVNSGGIFQNENLTPVINITYNPEDFRLSQNYPNPFNPATVITFEIPRAANLQLIVYDAVGKEVEVLLNGMVSSGKHSVVWDGSNYPSSIYFYKLMSGDFSETKKMVLIK